MSNGGYDEGNTDAETEYALALNQKAIEAVRALLPSGPTSFNCHDCGEKIPKARRKILPGCKYCVFCQAYYDRRPTLRAPESLT